MGGGRFEWGVLTLQALIWLTLTNENITNIPIQKKYTRTIVQFTLLPSPVKPDGFRLFYRTTFCHTDFN